jgi:siroheme synthase
MGVSTANLVAQALLDAGWTPATPVIAVENASRLDERRVLSTIGEVASAPQSLGLKSPAVLIFGEVAGLEAAGVVEHAASLPELRLANG